MPRRASVIYLRDRATHERAIEALAHEAQVPIKQVAELYARELAVLTAGARITGFLTILTTRKVRELLRQGPYPVCLPAARIDVPANDSAERWLASPLQEK